MGLKNMTRDTLFTLCKVFNEGYNAFLVAAGAFPPAEREPARDIAREFRDAASAAQIAFEDNAPEMLPQLDRQVDALAKKLDGLTDPRFQYAKEDICFAQKIAYQGLSPQAREDLGSYSQKIF